MKYIYKILVVVMFLPFVLMAKNEHLKILVFGDTNDSSIGQSVATDIASYKKLAVDIKSAVDPEGVKTTLDVFSGYNCSYKKLNDFLDDFDCENDIVFFIYNGHGGRSHKDESKFPRMCLGSQYESEWMKISDLNDKLRSKNPRLMVVVTDCCNSYYDRRRSGNENAYGLTTNKSTGDGFRQLFLNSTGEVCITAASPGEYGWGTSLGGLLSLSFIDAIYKFDAKGESANWHDLLKQVSDDTYQNSLAYYNNRLISNTQRPVYDVKITNSDYTETNNDTNDNSDVSNDVSEVDDELESDYLDSDDELYDELYDYEDEKLPVGKALFNALWIALLGLLFLWVPKFLKFTGGLVYVLRIIGIVFIVWALVAFFTKI